MQTSSSGKNPSVLYPSLLFSYTPVLYINFICTFCWLSLIFYCSCYRRYCTGADGASILSLYSAESSAICSEAATIIPSASLPAGVATTTLSSKTPAKTSGPVATPGTGTGAGLASTANGAATSATSKAAAMKGMGHTVPVLGGVLGALFGVVGVFL